MAAYYDVVDPIGGLAAGPPYWSYTKVFQGNANFMSDTMFLMWVRTLYKSLAESASVRVNGQEIGKLDPRPFPYLPPGETRNYFTFDAVSLVFPRTVLLGGPYFWSPVYNTLEIVPVSGAAWVMLEKVFFFRNTF